MFEADLNLDDLAENDRIEADSSGNFANPAFSSVWWHPVGHEKEHVLNAQIKSFHGKKKWCCHGNEQENTFTVFAILIKSQQASMNVLID